MAVSNILKPGNASLSVSNLGKRFGAQWAIRGFGCDLKSGQVLGLLGANGGGKTTTLRMMAGLLVPDEGGGAVNGIDLCEEHGRLSGTVGYMEQNLALYDELTVRENLLFRAEVYALADPKAALRSVMDRFGIAEKEKARIASLSGGWRRRVQFAAATMHQPSVLLLDEPTAGLDLIAAENAWRWIRDFADAGKIVVVATHDAEEAAHCDSVSVLSEGRVLLEGEPQKLVQQSGQGALKSLVRHLIAAGESGSVK